MIVVTGGAGFIGSAFIWKLNAQGIEDILVVDALDDTDKWKNLVNLRFDGYLDHQEFIEKINSDSLPADIRAIVHMGACSATTERDSDYLMRNNYQYTRRLAEWSLVHKVRFIYASSGATYGNGDQGYSDEDAKTPGLKPMNMYGYSKHLLDLWALKSGAARQMAGLKFFNVFGPNEYHKEDMRSVVHKAFGQIKETGKVGLFKSYKPEYNDGEQVRDFVYVKDVVEVMWWLLNNPTTNGIFNVGTGKARTWKDLVYAVFTAMAQEPKIEFIEMPENLRDRYQYRTEAAIDKLIGAGYPGSFMSLENAVADYVQNYLMKDDPHL
ncbi:ADP-glyceromanno-heptose 6-epimerase [bacterium]|nr:ADP-glyceromanno-heptose 6-epimerase [bacterium]